MQNGTTEISEISEISRHLDLLRGEGWSRNILSAAAIGFTAIYLPLWITALCMIGNITCDVLAMHYMRALSPNQHVWRYRLVAALSFFRETFLTLAAAQTWIGADSYAQSLAIGILMAQLLQLALVRANHLPFGYVGLAAVALITTGVNTYNWQVVEQNLIGLAVSSTAIVCTLWYTTIAMHSNHRLHRASATDRAEALANDKAKSRFLAQMSHELRTPLNAILGMGHAELRRNKDALSQNRLSVLIASAEGLSTILDDVLDMSAVDAGRLPIRPEAVLPREEILAALALFQPAAAAAGLTLDHDLAKTLNAPMMLDPQRLRQCLSNLLSNALKNTPSGGVHLAARLLPETGSPSLLEITVADTGPGIPTAMHRAIFEPFSQARSSKVEQSGNGLGLSICRSMARHMGGDLKLAPNTDDQTGARFILTLGISRAPVSVPTSERLDSAKAATRAHQQTQPPKARDKATAPATTVASGLRVLVIDDISTNRLVASTYLRMLGATMIEAESGEKALEILSSTQPDLILLDLNMPGMNGLQTLKRIRAMPGPTGKIPVIAMTADALAEQRAFYLTQGIDGYLAKPINPTRIEMEIKAVMDKRGPPPAD